MKRSGLILEENVTVIQLWRDNIFLEIIW
jgi:hypothetical protein